MNDSKREVKDKYCSKPMIEIMTHLDILNKTPGTKFHEVAMWHPPQNSKAVVSGRIRFLRKLEDLVLMPIQTLKQTVTHGFGYSMQEHEWEPLLEYLGAEIVGLEWNGSVYVPATLRRFIDQYFGQP